MAPSTASTRRRPAAAPAGTARERLLAVADELFYREGIHTVGIDRIIEEAGVAKASLYNTFGSKDELVKAYLQERRERITARVQAAVGAQTDPREQLLAIFDSQAKAIAQPDFNGCAFAGATAESHSAAVDAATADYRGWFRRLFVELATAAGATEPQLLGHQLHLLYDGVVNAARLDKDMAVASIARTAAATLIDAARP